MPGLGVAIIGLNGAVSSTIIAGVRLMAEGKAERFGMLTESHPGRADDDNDLTKWLDFAPLESMVFGGWDIHDRDLYDATLEHGVLRPDQLAPIKQYLTDLRPWPAVFSNEYATNIEGKHCVVTDGHRGDIAQIQQHLNDFRQAHDLDNVVIVNLASTEKWMEPAPVYETLEAFEAGLDANDPAITPSMRYAYAANACGMPHANFTPSLANVPALAVHAEQHGVPYAGMDGKTGQTLMKTALGPMFRARRLWVDGWYSINFLGNNDGLVLNDPKSNKTKVASKASVLDACVGHPVDNHQVHIHYYPPRGDAKEAWDNIDFRGFAGLPMQMKVNFLCQDSILAAPLIVDLARLLAVAQKKGEKGIQRQLSIYFKSPYHGANDQPVHDLFEQERMLLGWAAEASKRDDAPARAHQST